MRRSVTGFTLIELMVVVAVVAILAAVALPSFREQVRKSRRSDAMAEVGRIQLGLERWRADHPSYSGYVLSSSSNYYTLTLSGVSGTGYTLTATPKGAQAGDRCGKLTLSVGTATPNAKPQWETADCN